MKPSNGRQKNLLSYLPTAQEHSLRQGYVGNLHSKSKVELEELLDRQKRLLSNRNFVARLPDGGAKIEKFASDLQERINALGQESTEVQLDPTEESVEVAETSSSAKDAASIEGSLNLPDGNNGDEEMHEIEHEFTNLAIHEGPHYAVVKKAENKPKKSKFWLNRQQEAKKKEEFSTNETREKHISSKISPTPLSAATITDPKTSALLISVHECRELHTRQQAAVKEQQAQLAAERIMMKYGIADSSLDSNPLVEELHPEGGFNYAEHRYSEESNAEETVPADLVVDSDDDLEAVD